MIHFRSSARRFAGEALRGSKTRIRRSLERLQVRQFAPSDLESLVFGQHHVGTQAFFLETLGSCHSVPLSQFPHYQYLAQDHAVPTAGCEYDRYLSASWEYRYGSQGNTPEQRWAKMESFTQLARQIQDRCGQGLPPFRAPIRVCRRPDGRWILVDGNHRASIALYMGLPIPAVAVRAHSHLAEIVWIPEERYGSGRLSRPYQSLYLGRREILTGRRRDIRERLSMVSHSDIADATVVDLGCNIGASCFLAAQEGAREVIGFDVSPRLVSAAIALNAYFASPCRFYVHDLNCGAPEDARPADTVFCFSIARHVERRDGLREALLRMTRKVLYFEGHPNTSLSDYGDLLPGDEFPKVELIGLLPEAVDRPRRNRPLWRCERRAET